MQFPEDATLRREAVVKAGNRRDLAISKRWESEDSDALAFGGLDQTARCIFFRGWGIGSASGSCEHQFWKGRCRVERRRPVLVYNQLLRAGICFISQYRLTKEMPEATRSLLGTVVRGTYPIQC